MSEKTFDEDKWNIELWDPRGLLNSTQKQQNEAIFSFIIFNSLFQPWHLVTSLKLGAFVMGWIQGLEDCYEFNFMQMFSVFGESSHLRIRRVKINIFNAEDKLWCNKQQHPCLLLLTVIIFVWILYSQMISYMRQDKRESSSTRTERWCQKQVRSLNQEVLAFANHVSSNISLD